MTRNVSFTWPYFIHHGVDLRLLSQTESYDVADNTQLF